jgi:Cellulase (glycosyl hydrolase family 5)
MARTGSFSRAAMVFCLVTNAFSMIRAQSSIVTLEGRRFTLNDQEFYPVVMNYGIDFLSNTVHPDQVTDVRDIMVSPASHTDESIGSYFEFDDQNALDAQFETHFQKMLDMGFNTIRLVNALPFMRRESVNGPRFYTMRVRHDLHNWTPDPVDYRLELDPPFFGNAVSAQLFTLIEHVLDLADGMGLKVILLCADDAGSETTQLTLATDQSAVDWYASYLHELGEALQGHPALLAYDLWNEPIWTNYDLLSLSKAQVCAYTTQWYDALKAADPEHLVTLGGAMHHELGSWDPAVMKLDFYSPHAYPYQSILFNYDLTTAYEAYKAELYWLGADCPMPWLIGETGFVAEDDALDPLDVFNGYNYHHLDDDPAHHQMPFMQGSETDQDYFAQMSLDAVRDYRGSGYSWWDFQNSRVTWLLVEFTEPDPKKWMQGNFFGLLKYGNDVTFPLDPNHPELLAEWQQTNPWRDKIAVGTFANYAPSAAPEALPQPPAHYGSWYSTGGDAYAQYTIEDLDGAPIPHALATVQWLYRTVNPNDGGAGEELWDRNTTDPSGQCTIRKRLATNIDYEEPEAKKLFIDATGAEHIEYYPDGGVPWPVVGSTIPMDRNRLHLEDLVVDHVVPQNAEEEHAAWSSLTLTDVVVEGDGSTGGVADFKARDVVHASGEFLAKHGSEAHLFTEPVFLDCDDEIIGMVPEGQAQHRSSSKGSDVQAKRLFLSFLQPLPSVRAYPNPCTARVQVSLTEGVGQCTIISSSGVVVFRSSVAAQTHDVDVSTWAAGEYSVRVWTVEGEQTKVITKL